MIECKCEHCGAHFEAPDSMIGKSEDCPLCGRRTKLLICVNKPESPTPRKTPSRASGAKFFPVSLAEEALKIWAAVCVVGAVALILWLGTGPFRGAAPPSIVDFLALLALVSMAISLSATANVLLYLRTIANNTARGGKSPR